MRYVGSTLGLIALGISLAFNYQSFHQKRALEWDVMFWRGEMLSMYERETLEPTYLDGQCCSPEGEGCNEPIYGSDC